MSCCIEACAYNQEISSLSRLFRAVRNREWDGVIKISEVISSVPQSRRREKIPVLSRGEVRYVSRFPLFDPTPYSEHLFIFDDS
jgi:hypothetical protein